MSRFSHPSYRHPSRKELHTRLPETATTVPESGNFLRFQLQRDAEHGFGLVVRTVQYQCQEAHPLRFADSFQEEENGLVGPKSDPKLADKTATTSGCSIDAAASSSFLVVVEMPPGPAASAGVKINDLILSCNGCRVCEFGDLAEAIGSTGQAALQVFRGFVFDVHSDKEC
eukprot:INCI7635.1.p1 GENE.INCI7635.1~~INCI7635.1.p1  ORF type:complete len:171 (-),score=25.29 INCI7635.1:286-798(-)